MCDRRADVCSDISVQLTNNFLSELSLKMKYGVFKYDSENKRQNLGWKQPTPPRPKVARKLKSQLNKILITFFNIKGIVHFELIP
jgi:hypothetical protein